MGIFDQQISYQQHQIQKSNKMAPIIAHYKSNNFPTAFEPLEVETGNMDEAPMSRTHQYRKVMKPLLERKRRARINKCLDELKDLMVYALQSEGESITKLEKADVLELTVNHMRKLKRQQQLQANPSLDMDRYRAGFTACASEVSRFMASMPVVNITMGTHLMGHLGSSISTLEGKTSMASAPLSPGFESGSSDCGYNSGRDSNSPVSVGAPSPQPQQMKNEAVWRPF